MRISCIAVIHRNVTDDDEMRIEFSKRITLFVLLFFSSFFLASTCYVCLSSFQYFITVLCWIRFHLFQLNVEEMKNTFSPWTSVRIMDKKLYLTLSLMVDR